MTSSSGRIEFTMYYFSHRKPYHQFKRANSKTEVGAPWPFDLVGPNLIELIFMRTTTHTHALKLAAGILRSFEDCLYKISQIFAILDRNVRWPVQHGNRISRGTCWQAIPLRQRSGQAEIRQNLRMGLASRSDTRRTG